MKTALKILKRDVGRLFHNPIALVVVFGIITLPSLYAWYCIDSNWDPYGHTDGIKVAVVNNDQPVDSDALGTVNVGKQVEDTLRQNDQFDWQFVSAEEAQNKVNDGTYYAAIVIPSTFSKDFTSVLTGKAKNPTVDYYVNEKFSAVAVKVTDAGANTIERQINSTFVSTVSETLADTAKKAGKKISSNVNTARSGVAADVERIDEQLGTAAKKMKKAGTSTDEWRTVVQDADSALDQVSDAIPQLKQSLSDAQSDLKKARSKADGANADFLSAVAQGSTDLTGNASTASKSLQDTASTMKQTYGSLDTAATRIDQLVSSNDQIISQLESLNRSDLASTIRTLRDQNDQLRNAASQMHKTADSVNGAGDDLYTAANTVTDDAAKGAQTLTDTASSFSDASVPAVAAALDTYASALGSLSSTVDGLEPQITQMHTLLKQMDDTLSQTKDTLETTGDSLKDTQKRLGKVVTDLDTIVSSLRLQQLSDLEDIDAQDVGDFMSSPVKLETQTVYPVSPYGSAVAPFYTNLALWIGCFMLIAVLRAETDREGFPNMTAKQAFLGRYLLMLLIAVIQSIVMLSGEIVMGVQVINRPLFLLAGMVISFSYITIVYSLAITFKHIGKALAVILLIFQIPGSSGMYPIEMMPGFFQAIHPLLPFTYGIEAMREAIGGLYGMRYAGDMAFLLLLVVPVGLFMGLVLRKYFLNVNILFDDRLRQTDVFDRESHGIHYRSRYSVHNVIQVLLNSREYRDALLTRVAHFNMAYPVIQRLGVLLVAVLPILMIVVMSFFQVQDVDVKIIMLCVVLAAIILVDTFLIFMEYMHDNLEYQMRLTDLSDSDLMDAVYRHIPMGKWKAEATAEGGTHGWRSRSRSFRERFARGIVDLNSPSNAGEPDEPGLSADMASSVRSKQVMGEHAGDWQGPSPELQRMAEQAIERSEAEGEPETAAGETAQHGNPPASFASGNDSADQGDATDHKGEEDR